MSAELDAFTQLELARQIADDEFFSPDEATKGVYSQRLREFRKSIELPSDEAIATIATGSRVLTVDHVKAQLRTLHSEAASASDMEAMVIHLANASGQSENGIRRLSEAIKRETVTAIGIESEAAAIAAEADRRQIGQAITPAYLLPTAVAQAIEARSRYLPTDGAAAVVPYLTAVGGTVKLGTEVVGSRVANLRVPINLYACLVGRSGAKKSPVGRQLVSQPTAELRSEIAEANATEHSAWEAACRDAKAEKQPAPHEPVPKRLVVSEYSGEALNTHLQAMEKAGLGLLIHRDELAGLFGSLNQYRGGKGGDEQQLLELYDGEGLTSLRVATQRTYSRAQVSIWGTTQPDVLRELVKEGDASGLWARFLFVPLPERVVPLPISTTPAEVAEMDAAAAMLATVCRRIYEMPPRSYGLSKEATEAFAQYESQRQQTALRAEIPAQSALFGKSAGKVLRVAGLLHLLRIATDEASGDDPIEADLINRAAALIDHLDAWAMSLHAEVANGEATGLMRIIHRIAEAKAAPIRWKDVWHRLSKAQRKEADASAGTAAMQALADAGYGEVEYGKRGGVSYRAITPLP